MGAKAIINGNLGKDPELRYVPSKNDEAGSDRAVCGFSVFQSHDRKNRETDKYEDAGGFWVDVNVWGNDAEKLAKLLKKGYPVKVEGVLYQHTWTDSDNVARSQMRIDVDRNGVTVMTYNVENITFKKASE